MANPQKQDGYVAVANPIWEALSKASLTGREYQIVMAVIRKTYGWNRKSSEISIKEFTELTGITTRSFIVRIIKQLELKSVIKAFHQHGHTTQYALNKNYETWLLDSTSILEDTSSLEDTVTSISEDTSTSLPGDTSTSILEDTSSGVDTLLYENQVKTKESHGADAPPSHPSLVDAIASDPITLEYRKCLSLGQIPKADIRHCIDKYKKLISSPGYTWLVAKPDRVEKAVNWYLRERVKPPEHKASLTHLFACLDGRFADRDGEEAA